MRVAILYSGFLRSWNQVRDNQLEMLGEADRFFFTTEEPEHTPYKQFVRDCTISYYPNEIHDYDSNCNPITKPHGSKNQWHARFINFSIVPTDYDCYCLSRTDIEISGKIDFSQYEMVDDRVYILLGNDHCNGCNDQFLFGNYMSMKKYHSVYTDYHKLFAQGKTFHTEYYATENLIAKGVEIVRVPVTNLIIREGDKTCYSKGSLKIASEEPQYHWGMLQVKDKRVLDLGCGRGHQQSITTPEYFLKQKAHQVIAVEQSDSEKPWYFKNVKDVKLTVITDRIDTPAKLEAYLTIFKPQVIKMDIEGDEKILEDFEKDDFGCVEQMAVEYHSAEGRQMITGFYREWGFVEIREYEMSLHNPETSGVIYLKK